MSYSCARIGSGSYPILFGSIRVNVQSGLTSQAGECELCLRVDPEEHKQKHPAVIRTCPNSPIRKNDGCDEALSRAYG